MRSLSTLFKSSNASRRRRSKSWLGESLESRELLTATAGALVRDYSPSSTYADPQSGTVQYSRFFRVSINGSAANDGTGAATATNYEEGIRIGTDFSQTGDFNGDGLQDVLGESGGKMTVALNLNTGSDFGIITDWGTIDPGSGANTYPLWVDGSGGRYLIGDFNGDGKSDLCDIRSSSTSGVNEFHVALSTGTSFGAWQNWGSFSSGTANFRIGDLNGDGKADILATTTTTGNYPWKWAVWTTNASGTAFSPPIISTEDIASPFPQYVPAYIEIRLGNFDGNTSNGLEMAFRATTGRGYDSATHQAKLNNSVWRTWDFRTTNLIRNVYTGTAWAESVPIAPSYSSYDERGFQNIRVGDFGNYSGSTADDVMGRDRYGNIHVLFSTGGVGSWSFNDQLINPTSPFTAGVTNPYQSGYHDNGNGIGFLGVYSGNFVNNTTATGLDETMWIDNSNVYLTTFSGVAGAVTSTTTLRGTFTSPTYWATPVNMDGGSWFGGKHGFGLF